ncbi:hypothetical protein DL990_36980 [Amycolatopsis sp. WAC 01416]|nr:hypothetical protein DL990_36980 [Amycolatopsis sp. WAC 01416]
MHQRSQWLRVKDSFPRYMKDPFLYLGARKGSFMYWGGQGHSREGALHDTPRTATAYVSA